ncbi:MAG: hypothetical protein Fur007_10220 [Rhodoferax sp.]
MHKLTFASPTLLRRTLLACPLALLASRGFAATDAAGYVTRVRGEAMLQLNDQARGLALGQALPQGARIRTGTDARLEARMQDGTLLTLGANTEFVVAAVARGGAARFELLKGAFRALTGKTAGEAANSWQVRTPVAVIGVRGTELWGGFDLLNSGAQTLDVVMLEGHGVWVQNDQGTTELARPLDGTTVAGASAIPAPLKPWGEKKLNAAIATVSW